MMTVRAFRTEVLRTILRDNCPTATSEDLLALWSFTGGVAKYASLLVDAGATGYRAMLREIIRGNSFFLDEGRAVLVDEFGKDYGHLTRLENDYGIIVRRQPMMSKPNAKTLRFALADGFFLFWFRFIERYGHLVEMRAFDELRRLVDRDYEVFSGFALERWFREKAIEKGGLTRLGGWWDRRGENEIDIIAANETEGRVAFCEVKRDPARVSLPLLRRKAEEFFAAVPDWRGYKTSFRGLSIENM